MYKYLIYLPDFYSKTKSCFEVQNKKKYALLIISKKTTIIIAVQNMV